MKIEIDAVRRCVSFSAASWDSFVQSASADDFEVTCDALKKHYSEYPKVTVEGSTGVDKSIDSTSELDAFISEARAKRS